ncbi:amidase [Alcaligenes aquatilis]|uniref:amidase n=1 Tax=Alcaligenes aquatilis TaxID=323284 RepID=UPI00362438E8
MKLSEYATYDALALAELVAKKHISVQELSQVGKKAVDALNSKINAVVESWDGEIDPHADRDSVLYGVPFLIKDLAITMKGKRYELGSKLAQGMVMDADSTLMSLYKEAGLVTLGRTTTSEFAISTTTEARCVGPTLNPWNPAFNAGGSIRVPAAVNGLFGLKPTRGRVSSGPLQDEVWSGLLAHLGVSRSVRDSAALLDAISRPGIGEPYYTAAPPQTFLSAVKKNPGALRIGLMMDPPSGDKTESVIAGKAIDMASVLESLGHQVESLVFDCGVSWEAFVHANAQFWNVNTAAWIDSIAAATGRPVNEVYLEQATLAAYAYGKKISGIDLLGAIAVRNTVSRNLGAYFQKYDVLMTPTVPALPMRVGEYNQIQDQVDGLGWIAHVFKQAPFAALANISGSPSMSVPAGQDVATSLPIGMMFTAAYGQECLLFGLAGQLEQALPWSDQHPQVWVGKLD